MRFLSNKIPNSTAPNIFPIRNHKHADQESAADKKILDMLNTIEQAIEQLQTQVSDMSDTIEHLQTQILEKTSYGVVSGLEVTAQDVPDMTVNVSSGII